MSLRRTIAAAVLALSAAAAAAQTPQTPTPQAPSAAAERSETIERLRQRADQVYRPAIEAATGRRLGLRVLAVSGQDITTSRDFRTWIELYKSELGGLGPGDPPPPPIGQATGYDQAHPQPKSPDLPSGSDNPATVGHGDPTQALTTTARRTSAGTYVQTAGSDADTCVIVAFPILFEELAKTRSGRVVARPLPEAIMRGIVAHETYHCFQPDIPALFAEGAGMFVGEGSAEFAAVTLEPEFGRHSAFLAAYAAEAKPLARRDYDAAGLYAHLQAQGIDMFRVFEAIYAGGSGDDWIGRFIEAIGPRGQMLWAMSEVDEPALGGAWVWTWPGRPEVRLAGRDRERIEVSDPRDVPRGTVRQFSLRLPRDKPVRVRLTGVSGAVRTDTRGAGETIELAAGGIARVCHGDDCPCAVDGQPVARSRTGEVLIAALGVAEDGSVLSSLDGTEPGAAVSRLPCCKPDGPLDARLIGLWEMDLGSWFEEALVLRRGHSRSLVPPTHGVETSGRLLVEIREDRTFHKRYEDAYWAAVPLKPGGSPYNRLVYRFQGEVRGCFNFSPAWTYGRDGVTLAAARTDAVDLPVREHVAWGADTDRVDPLRERTLFLTWGNVTRPGADGGAQIEFESRDSVLIRWVRYRRVSR